MWPARVALAKANHVTFGGWMEKVLPDRRFRILLNKPREHWSLSAIENCPLGTIFCATHKGRGRRPEATKDAAMPSLAGTIARLSKLRTATIPEVRTDGHHLAQLTGSGSNPGSLQGWLYLPHGSEQVRALVVVLHGCTQTPDSYDAGSGWSQLASRHGFALLFPEQQRQNNHNLCFNWFSSDHNQRGHGEALSISQMVETALARHRIDPARVFVTGLSAGGAMASVMLATYPELFAGGAIIAGLPYGCAGGVPQAFERMRGHGMPAEAELSKLVRSASPHRGPWPILSVWHGSGDATVNPANANAIVSQWRSLHGVGREPSRIEAVDGYPRRVWCDASGREVIEEYSITGMGHGTPLDTIGAQGCGTTGAFMLEASISSTYHICRFWGLAKADGAAEDVLETASSSIDLVPAPARAERARPDPTLNYAERIAPTPTGTGAGVGKIIEDALRAARLMR